jgi:hypothetical protein
MEMLNYNNLSKSELFEMFKIKRYKNKNKLKFISKHQKDIFFICKWVFFEDDFYDLQIDFYKKNQSFKNYENEILYDNSNLYSFFDDVIDLYQYIDIKE